MDIGATDHIIYDPSLFTESKPDHKSFVSLPNSYKAEVKAVGSVNLHPLLVLKVVLLVSDFNLISVSKLITQNKKCLIFMYDYYLIRLIFMDDYYLIQDLST